MNSKTDWSEYNRKYGRSGHASYTRTHSGEVDARLDDSVLPNGSQTLVSAAGNALEPASPADLGLLMRHKANRLQQEAALVSIKDTLAAVLDVRRHYLNSLVGAKKARIDIELKEYTAFLEAEHLRLTGEFDVRLFEERADLLMRLTNAYLGKVRAVMNEDWPDDDMDLLIGDLRALREGIAGRIKENFAARYQRTGPV